MQNTVCENCPFVKMGFCADVRDCPNYCESWWTQGGETTPKLLKDCSPKRLLIQQQYLQLRLEQLTASNDAQRNENLVLVSQLKTMIDMTNAVLVEHSKTLKLDQKDEIATVTLLNSY
jgi:hypothetical protein